MERSPDILYVVSARSQKTSSIDHGALSVPTPPHSRLRRGLFPQFRGAGGSDDPLRTFL